MGLAVALLAVGIPTTADAQQTLNLATWGGAYGRAQEIALLEPFAKKTGTVIATEIYGGDAAKLKTLLQNTKTPLDVVDVSAGTLEKFCDEGLLAPIDADAFNTTEESGNDFLPGALSKCGVATMAWSTAIAFSRKSFRTTPPASIGALLDISGYPGKRALPNSAQRTLELALLADGVAPNAVYGTLTTPEGADRAFSALERIKGSLLLWDEPNQPMTWLMAGRVVIAAGYSGRLFRAAVRDPNVGLLWDGQVYDLDAWAIPKTSRKKDEALRFIVFATEPAQLAAQARLTAYGPMRPSALAQVNRHPAIGVEMLPYLPTTPNNFRSALKFDQDWWDEKGDPLEKRFAAWADRLQNPNAANTPSAQSSPESETDKPSP